MRAGSACVRHKLKCQTAGTPVHRRRAGAVCCVVGFWQWRDGACRDRGRAQGERQTQACQQPKVGGASVAYVFHIAHLGSYRRNVGRALGQSEECGPAPARRPAQVTRRSQCGYASNGPSEDLLTMNPNLANPFRLDRPQELICDQDQDYTPDAMPATQIPRTSRTSSRTRSTNCNARLPGRARRS